MSRSSDGRNIFRPHREAVTLAAALRLHWPEYLIEGWALGCLMMSVGMSVSVLESPRSPIYTLIPSAGVRIVVLALIVGLTLTLLIQSPWGKRSGAHMNPAITLAFLRQNKIRPSDALFYILAQIAGGTLGVVAVAFFAGSLFTDPPVHYAVTMPGPAGEAVAFLAEGVISFALMAAILFLTTSPRLTRYTGLAVGGLVTLFIIVEAPLSGTSMNPARTLASAVPGMSWQHLWIYLLAPTLGMLAAAQLDIHIRGSRALGCAKLLHPCGIRCIHCNYEPYGGSSLAIVIPRRG